MRTETGKSLEAELCAWFHPLDSCVVAFSGGLDSTVVAKAAAIQLGENAVAVMATGATCTEKEVEDAEAVAAAIPIRFITFSSPEMLDERFTANDVERCYYCKRLRFQAIREYAALNGIATVLDGSNADDLDDFRPGRKAALFRLRSPLAELGFDKNSVRTLARSWNLPNSEKPASPCLATRIAYGLRITEDRLRKIEKAENLLNELRFSPVRVRLHSDELVRIEVAEDKIVRLLETPIRERILRDFGQLGFTHISVDLHGFRSGNMNGALQPNKGPEA